VTRFCSRAGPCASTDAEREAQRPAQSAPNAAPERGKTAWLTTEERGTILAIRFVVALCNLAGRSVARAFVSLLMVYYTVFAAQARRASRAFLHRALGRRAGWLDAYRHLRTFGLVTLDRVFLLQGKRALFDLSAHGTELLTRLSEQKRGALLLGAHVGSFEVMRARADGRGHDIRVLAYLGNAKKINQVFAALSPEMQARIIPLGSMDALIRAKEALDQGAILAMLGDRTGLNEKTTYVDFMGEPAPFPTGPFLLSAALRCPVLLVFGIYLGKNRYQLFCEPFAERIILPRKERATALQSYVQAYAARLEHIARAHPHNWFNLYNFWDPTRPD
jgi:predicted LPLAT superfamily acyltransferase